MNNQKEITEQQALNKLMTLCARSEHSSGEMLQKMRLWGLSDEAQARIMERLTKDGQRALAATYKRACSMKSMRRNISKYCAPC